MKIAKLLLYLVCVSLSAADGSGQKLDPDPDRIFVTPLKWERIGGVPRSVKERVAYGKLSIFYLEGVYAEVRGWFIRKSAKQPIGLNLNEGFVIRLGTWSRTDDEQLIRIEARDVFRDKIVGPLKCEVVAGERDCVSVPENPLPGPMKYSTCRLERPSTVHIAETIVCTGGLTVSHLKERMDLADFPEIVRKLVSQESHQNSTK